MLNLAEELMKKSWKNVQSFLRNIYKKKHEGNNGIILYELRQRLMEELQ